MGMDVLCDTLLLEEILPRLPPKCLLRLGATSRRYNALARRPDFAARYWQRAGVIFQPFDQPEVAPRFLTAARASVVVGGGGHATAEQRVPGADLAFLPGPSAIEEAYLRHIGVDPECGIGVLHSAGGLLLCCRGRNRPLHFYVCNPVTRQWVALPELPLPACKRHCGHLTVDTAGDRAKSFKVVLLNHPSHWQTPGGQLELRVFASDTGRWEAARRFPAPVLFDDEIDLFSPPILGPSGTSYWTFDRFYLAVAYDSAGASDSVRVITVPDRLPGGAYKYNSRCIGERHGGGLRYMHSDGKLLEVWDAEGSYAQAQQGGGGHGGAGVSSWTLVHRVTGVELLERNPGAAAFLSNKNPRTWNQHYIKPLGVHPTDGSVVFVSLPGAVVAYSIEHGTMSLACANDLCVYVSSADTFPYVHPPFPLQIPAIKSSVPTLQENGGPAAPLEGRWKKKRKRMMFTEPF